MTAKLTIAMSATVALLIAGSQASAQQRNQTIQLPVLRQFNVRSSVSVPDGGTIGLGGVTRSSTGRRSRGIPGTTGRPFSNRAGGRLTSSNHASVRVWVLSKEEINEAILAGATLTKESTVPYYKQVWDRQRLNTLQPTPLKQSSAPAPIVEANNQTDTAEEPEGIFLGLP